MTQSQKVIKYIAVVLAVGLIVCIVGGVLGVIGLFGGFFGNDAVTEEMMFYGVKEDICSLNIEINAADITIKEGDTFSVESNLKHLRVKEKACCLSIVQTGNFRGSHDGAVLIITVPVGTVDSIHLQTGAGKFTAENLTAETLNLHFGAGEVSIGTLVATERVFIEGGTGRITISDGALHDLDLDMGVGELNLTSLLTGDCELNTGVGKLNLNLIGVQEDYALEIEKGIGKIYVDGEKVTDYGSFGNGENKIDIDGGIGAINITFKEANIK